MRLLPLEIADVYKVPHKSMYHPEMEYLYSNFTPRFDRHFSGSALYDHKLVVAGITAFCQEFLIELFNREFFNRDVEAVMAEYEAMVKCVLPGQSISLDHIRALWTLGYLPIEIRALPEGTRVGMGIPVFTVTNTEKGYGWLVNYIETLLSNANWKTMTNATTAFEYRRVAEYCAMLTCDNNAHVLYQGHDFSGRGMSGPEDSARSNIGHLMSFSGTDNMGAIRYAVDYYGAEIGDPSTGCSVPATEHSVVTSFVSYLKYLGMEQIPAEKEFIRRLITEIFPTGIVANVCDAYDYWAIVTEVLPSLKAEILGRDGKFVVRPDSGDPVRIICGYNVVEYATADDIDAFDLYYERDCRSYTDTVIKIGDKYHTFKYTYVYDELDDVELTGELPEYVVKGSIEVLWETFGGRLNNKGFKELDPHIGLIYGDSITLQRQEEIFKQLMAKGFASNNINLGIGSYTYNFVTRDTFGSAMKATGTVIAGHELPVYKDPKTDSSKRSAKGFIRVEREGDNYVMYDGLTYEESKGGALEVVFRGYNHSTYFRTRTLREIREQLNQEIQREPWQTDIK